MKAPAEEPIPTKVYPFIIDRKEARKALFERFKMHLIRQGYYHLQIKQKP